ncbi:hypothetical protein SAMN05216582_10139 [Selenomonas ruminantium]|uniref:Uncharacterized protein n=1 Tax=Selenomonas ruminantium TaxID=971 RepID=A0A1M6QXZ9_SELRU|nr:hypothetical protein [Selenomonas ruminantium]SHK24947.1 hypothetical protein SAMN05216582_10139 [Selenomonas ruminantium]
MKREKFSLLLSNKTYVRNDIDELRSHYEPQLIIKYFHSGELQTWLEDRYYDEEAEQISELSKDDPNLPQKLCAILGVSAIQHGILDDAQLKRLNEKKALLLQRTTDESIISKAPQTAFTQEDLADLLDMGESTIYLCGEVFTIPIRMTDKTYIGLLGTPRIKIKATSENELQEKNIILQNTILPWSEMSSPATNQPMVKSPISPVTLDKAKKLLVKISDKNFRQWGEGNLVWFICDIQTASSKREIESSLKSGAKESEQDLPTEIADNVDRMLDKLREVQETYDSLFTGGITYMNIIPPLSEVNYQLPLSAEKIKYDKPMDLGNELVKKARYMEMESDGFSGIFGVSDYFLQNPTDLAKVVSDYCHKVYVKLDKSSGGKALDSYLESMVSNLKTLLSQK